MKKMISLLVCMALCLSMLVSCAKTPSPAPEASSQPDGSASVSAEASPDVSDDAEPEENAGDASEEAPDGSTEEFSPYMMVDAADAFEGGYLFVAEESGTYTFTCTNSDDYADETWDVYALEEPFEDALRYLPQAMSSDDAPEGISMMLTSGSAISTEIEAGNIIYCLSSMNPWTADKPDAGASVLEITIEVQ